VLQEVPMAGCEQGCTTIRYEEKKKYEARCCPRCKHNLFDEKSGEPIYRFRYRSLKEQLKLLLLRPEISKMLQVPEASPDEKDIKSPWVRFTGSSCCCWRYDGFCLGCFNSSSMAA
jgi:hypothetical protein